MKAEQGLHMCTTPSQNKLTFDSSSGNPSAAKSINKNLLAVACEAESMECVDYVIGEIMAARRRTLRSCSGGGNDSSAASDTGSIDFRV